MTNKKQRMKNRENAEVLRKNARGIKLSKHICENCGEPGGHWISTRGSSLEAILTGVDDQEGFWTCSKYYGEDGKRLPEHINPMFSFNSNAAAMIAALLISKKVN